mmetsp:Transcript_17708/g.60188  ORF Transcript_17708/g.60188 Transcript_17708/m.60188 type:complete len:215 (+) Transcript_17708:335-979(+)
MLIKKRGTVPAMSTFTTTATFVHVPSAASVRRKPEPETADARTWPAGDSGPRSSAATATRATALAGPVGPPAPPCLGFTSRVRQCTALTMSRPATGQCARYWTCSTKVRRSLSVHSLSQLDTSLSSWPRRSGDERRATTAGRGKSTRASTRTSMCVAEAGRPRCSVAPSLACSSSQPSSASRLAQSMATAVSRSRASSGGMGASGSSDSLTSMW